MRTETVLLEKDMRNNLNIDYIRIIDPAENRIISHGGYLAEERSALEKKYAITSIPITFMGRSCIVEIFMDMPDNAQDNGEEKDYLTGLYNRRFIDESLESFFLLNAGKVFSLILIDIDHFKDINDTFGHLAGDNILKQFSEKLQDSIRRQGDWVARYGGEEFIIFLDGADGKTAESIAERIRKKIFTHKFYYNGIYLNLSASFGVVTSCANPDISPNKILSLADKKLYEAKREGRNRVVSHIS
jgi:diguanylate cyclase (GGDEF)-like protein